MEEKDRPGGLTALAVINFIFAAFGLIGIPMLFVSKLFISNIPPGSIDRKHRLPNCPLFRT